MKTHLLLICLIFFFQLCQSQSLELEGSIKISDELSDDPPAGTIRWNETTRDFEGWTGSIWKSLTTPLNRWGELVPVYQSQKLLASDGASANGFGAAVSISGDYAIIGAFWNESVYIFKRSSSGWVEQIKLVLNDGAGNENFGYSVDIYEDYAIVGANTDNDNGASSGSAFIFIRSGTSWTRQAKLLPIDGASGDQFGRSVGISGNYAVVGANNDDDNGDSSGSAYIFERSGSSWNQKAKLVPTDGATKQYFGSSVGISGNYVIVGSPNDDDKGGESGSAYIFVRSIYAFWSQQTKLLASDGAAGDYFGRSVSISGNYALVGSPEDDDDGSRSGSAYVFGRSGSNWIQQSKIKAGDGAREDIFGISVDLSGDYAIVGALWDDENGYSSGSAYIFGRSGNSWIQKAKLLPSDGAAGDYFGGSVGISGAYAIVAAAFDDDQGSSSGSAYIFIK